MSIVVTLFCLCPSAEVVSEGIDPSPSGQYSRSDQCMHSDYEDQGWLSWAWSFVPAIINTEEEEYYAEMENTGNPNPMQSSYMEPIVSVGFYCTKASVIFKVKDNKLCFMLGWANSSGVKGKVSTTGYKGYYSIIYLCI